MSYVVQPREQVQILEPDHTHEGQYAYVSGTAGDTDSLSDTIPTGWVEVQLSPGVYELFRERHVIPSHLTL